MIKNLILGLYFVLFSGGVSTVQNIPPQKENVLSSRTISLENRYPSQRVSDVFKDNILLNLAYLDGRVDSAQDINWAEIDNSFRSEFTLQPNETFAYHDAVLPRFDGKVVKTTEAHFNYSDGFKTDGYLYGDGVCHLASLINWAAREAKLDVLAPANHDFANIPEVPKEYGVSIYAYPGSQMQDQMQNLYITNNKEKEIAFEFKFDGENLKISAVEIL